MKDSSILKKLKFPQTAILLEINSGKDYAKTLEENSVYGKVVENYPRTLNLLMDYGLLKQTIVQPKNKKIYSIDEDKIASMFIERLIQKSNKIVPKGKLPKYDYFKVEYKDSEKIEDLIKILKETIKQIKKSDSKQREPLKKFLIKEVFILAYDAGFRGNLTELFDETIIGIGEASTSYKVGLKHRALMPKIEFICDVLVKFIKIRELRSKIKGSYEKYRK